MIGAFVKAARLRTLPLAIASIAMGSVLGAYFQKHNWSVTLLAVLTAILLQILSNFANDYGDFVKGTDDDSRSDRALASGSLSLMQMRAALIITSILSLLSGLTLLYVALGSLNLNFLLFLGLGLLSIAAAIKYTAGKNAYGYKSWGDISVFIFFGLVAVLGVYYLQSGHIDRDFRMSVLPASALGLLGVGVLNVNNIRDIAGDTQNGKITLAVKFGKKRAEIYQIVLCMSALILLAVFLRETSASSGLVILLLAPLYIIHWLRLKSLTNRMENRPAYNKLLKLHVLLNLITVLITSLILL
jgi:1,4-dihydroxy-2-naphthoate octaprenyltransferase